MNHAHKDLDALESTSSPANSPANYWDLIKVYGALTLGGQLETEMGIRLVKFCFLAETVSIKKKIVLDEVETARNPADWKRQVTL